MDFLACRDIGVGDEVVWDYGVRGEDWSGCQLVGGVVKTATEIRGRGSKRAREVEGGQESEGGGEPEGRQESERGGEPEGRQESEIGGEPEGRQESEGGGEPEGGQESEGGGEPVEKAKEARHDGAGLGKPPTKKKKQKLCMCPICHSGPHVKISNHLIQKHHILDKKERDRYLRDNRIIATPAQMVAKTRSSIPVRRSQRTITCFLKGKESAEGQADVVEVESSDSEGYDPLSSRTTGRATPRPPSPTPPSPTSPSPTPSKVKLTVTTTASAPSPGQSAPSTQSVNPGQSATSSPSARPGPSSATLCGKSTRNAPRFDLDEPFLKLLDGHLGSRVGGRRDIAQRRGICVDVSKYLCFVNPDACNPDHLLSRSALRRYISWLEDGGIGPSGVITKLRRVQLVITCLGHEHEEKETEADFCVKREKVAGLISSVLTSLSRQKRKIFSLLNKIRNTALFLAK